MAFDLLCMQISTTCDNYNKKNTFIQTDLHRGRHSMGCNCRGIVINVPLVSSYFPWRGTQRDVTAVVSLLMFH